MPERSAGARPSSRRGFAAVLLVCLLSLVALGCGDDKRGQSSAPPPKPPAPAPPGLLAELIVPQPRQLLAEVRDAAGGPAVLLPRSLGVLMANTLGYPIRSAEMFDEQLPLVAAATQGAKPGETHWVLAIHVRKRDELLLLLTGGAQPKYERRAAGEATCLPARPSAQPSTPRPLGCLLDHYLLISSSEAAAEQIGPYAARTLAARKPPRPANVWIEAKPSALSQWLPKQLAQLQRGMKERAWPARLRSIVDAEVLLSRAQTLSAEAERAEIVVTLNAKAWRAHGTLYPKDDATRQRWQRAGTIAPKDVQQLPDDTIAAASWSQALDSRRAQARQQAALVTAGEGFSPDDRQALEQALQALASGRGDRTLLGLRCTGVGLTGYASSDIGDRDKLTAALDELLAFTRREGIEAQLKQRELTLSQRSLRMLKVPADITLLRLQPARPEGKAPDPAAALSAIDLRYGLTDKQLLAAAGYETVDTLKLIYGPDPERNLAAKPTVDKAFEGRSAPAWMLAYADPQGIHACQSGKPGGAFSTPLLLRLGPDPQRNAEMQLYFARELVRVLVREVSQ